MASMDELYTALRRADAAGDAEGARRLAAHIKTMQSQPAPAPQNMGAAPTVASQPAPPDSFEGMKAAAYKRGQDDAAGFVHDTKMAVPNALAGLVRGAGSIGSTLLAPIDMALDALDGKGLSLESNRMRRAGIDATLADLGADPNSIFYKGGKWTSEVAGTAGVGPALAIPLRAAGAPSALVQAVSTAGMRTGLAPTTMAGRAANLGLRSAAGATVGGTSAALVNPDHAESGAVVGGLLPPALVVGAGLGNALDRMLSGPTIPDALRSQISQARSAGYVIPPTQAKPTLINRTLEGLAGKLSTAQSASAKNQAVTNGLAMRAIGADDLSEAGLRAVRQRANAAYDQLGQSAPFVADPQFAAALDQAGAGSAAMHSSFPGLSNDSVDTLLQSLKSSPQFEAQPTIEAIKRLRSNANMLRRSDDPAKVEFGRTQAKVATALEDLIDRNLQATDSPGLLDAYRNARQTLAKTYDVEKALNPASGNVDARKLAQQLKKGRPLTGDLQTVAEFATAFPKAAQPLDSMGSLPGLSPLDFTAAGLASAATSNPMMMATGLARPAARSVILSPVIQNKLLPRDPGLVQKLLRDIDQRQLLYRAAPVSND